MRLILDTNIFVGACLTAGASNLVLAACLKEQHQPILGNSLFSEYEDVLARTSLFERSRLSKAEREELFDIFVSRCQWLRVYYQWRPNLRDEADSHLNLNPCRNLVGTHQQRPVLGAARSRGYCHRDN
jgi:predicted nucleic acid-binding protein